MTQACIVLVILASLCLRRGGCFVRAESSLFPSALITCQACFKFRAWTFHPPPNRFQSLASNLVLSGLQLPRYSSCCGHGELGKPYSRVCSQPREHSTTQQWP